MFLIIRLKAPVRWTVARRLNPRRSNARITARRARPFVPFFWNIRARENVAFHYKYGIVLTKDYILIKF